MSISAVRSNIVVSPRRPAPVAAAAAQAPAAKPTQATVARPAQAPVAKPAQETRWFDSKAAKIASYAGLGVSALGLLSCAVGWATGNPLFVTWGLASAGAGVIPGFSVAMAKEKL